MGKPEVLLIDLGSIYWAAWHSSANEEISAAHDRAVAHVRKLREGYELVAVCCDSPKNDRKQIDPKYKANRPAQDSAAYEQLRNVKATLHKDGMLLWEESGLEADDVLASACRLARANGHAVTIASADKDLTQLVGEGVIWNSPKTGERLDREGVRSKFGVYPEKMRDWLAICGDSSDNIAGVQGVGPKGATKLLDEYGSLDQILAASAVAPIATPKINAAFEASREALALGVRLIALRDDAPIKWEEIYERREAAPLTKEGPIDMSGIDEQEEESGEKASTEPFDAAVSTEHNEAISVVQDAEKQSGQSLERIQAQTMLVAPSWDLALEPTSLGAAFKLATGLYNSRLYSRFPSREAIWAVIIRGREMGMGALTSLDNFHVIEGKPAPHAHLLIARAKAHPDCEYFQFVGGDATYAEYKTKSRQNPNPTTLRYTIDDARKAGLLKPGSNWEKRPAEMLRKTCGVQLGRIEYPDAMQGLYSIEELSGDRAA